MGPPDAWAPDERRAVLVGQLGEWFAAPAGWRALAAGTRLTASGKPAVELDFEELRATCPSADLFAALDVQPAEGLACLAAACYDALFATPAGRPAAIAAILGRPAAPAPVLVRLANHAGALVPVRAVKANLIGKLVALRGTVVRTGPVSPLVTRMAFACGKCGAEATVAFPDGRFRPPPKCGGADGEGCRNGKWAPVQPSARCVDWQRVRLQEIVPLKGDPADVGQIPRTVECELTEELVNSCRNGDVVTVTGLVKVINADVAAGKRPAAGGEGLFLLYLDAVSVSNPRTRLSLASSGASQGSQDVGGTAPPNMLALSARDKEFALAFAAECGEDALKQLVNALCPTIYGHEVEKAGLVLALFGGVQKHSADPSKVSPGRGARRGEGGLTRPLPLPTPPIPTPGQVPVRGDIHVLLVGDPGLGKSQMLKAAAAGAPRGVYVCGKSTSGVGLTAAVVKDAMTGDFTFEAGAVVMADKGCCCVDEFDKIKQEHEALLEVMEQQAVSIAKAGLVASLPARTSVLAAANPTGGHYNRGKTVHENLKVRRGPEGGGREGGGREGPAAPRRRLTRPRPRAR